MGEGERVRRRAAMMVPHCAEGGRVKWRMNAREEC